MVLKLERALFDNLIGVAENPNIGIFSLCISFKKVYVLGALML